MTSKDEVYKVIVSDRAAEMLVQHMRFLSQISIQAADKLRVEIIEAAKSLRYFPERNAPYIIEHFQYFWYNVCRVRMRRGVNTINEHIKHIFEDGELEEKATIRKFRIVQYEVITLY